MQVAPGAWRYAVGPLALAAGLALFALPVAALAGVAAAAVLLFHRDPDRSPPQSGVIAPADGKVTVVREEGDRIRVGVFMGLSNVHVNRAPLPGVVRTVEHEPGAHWPAFTKESERNERTRIVFDEVGQNRNVGGVENVGEVEDVEDVGEVEDVGDVDGFDVVLVAGAVARRTHSYVESGQRVDRGERIGHISFGSRVDVVMPTCLERDDLAVTRGDRVRAGETVLAPRA